MTNMPLADQLPALPPILRSDRNDEPHLARDHEYTFDERTQLDTPMVQIRSSGASDSFSRQRTRNRCESGQSDGWDPQKGPEQAFR
jgi:hypothetical protein